MLVYGDSVMLQVFFAMLCSLHAHSALRPISFWPSPEPFRLLPWHQGVETASGFKLTFWFSYQTGLGTLCNKTVTSALCPHVLRQQLHDFDIVLLSSGLEYHSGGAYRADLRPLLRMLQAAVEKRPGLTVVFSQPSAQHFANVDRTGLYEGRFSDDELRASPAHMRHCHCPPTDPAAPIWRNTLLESLLASAPAVRMLPFHNLTQPRWHMHYSHLWDYERGANGDVSACDCTHFCCVTHDANQCTPPLTSPSLLTPCRALCSQTRPTFGQGTTSRVSCRRSSLDIRC